MSCVGEGVKFGVVKFMTVVTLYERKRQAKLGMSEHTKGGEHGVSFGFLA
jgi:hypothetical protein